MRASRSSLVTIALGVGVVLVSAVKALDVGRTAFALFVATAILVELFEESDRERMREPGELALLDSLDETGLALAARPQLDGSRSQSAEPLETAADPRDFVLARLDER